MGTASVRTITPVKTGFDRREHARHHLGLPIRVHFDGGSRSANIELSDVSRGGGRFEGYLTQGRVRVGETIAFGFVLPGPVSCVAAARVTRVEGSAFAVQVARANEAFEQFVATLETQGPQARS